MVSVDYERCRKLSENDFEGQGRFPATNGILLTPGRTDYLTDIVGPQIKTIFFV